MPFTYILECSDKSFYTGSARDLERRLIEHQTGEGANYTKKRRPITLVYWEEYDRIDDAFYREKQIQKWSRAKKVALIEGRLNDLPKLAKKQFRKNKIKSNCPLGTGSLSRKRDRHPYSGTVAP